MPQRFRQLKPSGRPPATQCASTTNGQQFRRPTVANSAGTPSAPRTLRKVGLVRYIARDTVLIMAPEQWPEGDCEPPYATVIRKHVDGTCDVRLLCNLETVVPRAHVRPADITLDSKTHACVRSFDNGDPGPAVLAEQWGFPRFATHDVVTTVGTVQCGRWPAPSDEEHAGAVIEQHGDGTCDIRLLCDPELTILRARVQPTAITLDSLDRETRTRILAYDDHTDAPLDLPDIVVQRVVALYDAGFICEPSDLLIQSGVCGREFGLANLVCLALMKQRGQVDHMRASEAHPPASVHPQYADNKKLARHHRSWLRGGSWACVPPPDVPNAALGSRATALRFTRWCCGAAVAAPPSRTFVPLTTGPHRFVGSFLNCLTQSDRDDPKHPCRSSCLPPRPP